MKIKDERRFTIRLYLILLYLILITILFVVSSSIYKNINKITPFRDVKSTNEYAEIDISKMSDKFAYYKENDIGIHYVTEIEDTGIWHTYLIAIKESEISKYQDIIDYSYGKTNIAPDRITVRGYPVEINEELKALSIKHLNEFLPTYNAVEINNDNYNDYLTNCYLDTTISKENTISFGLVLTLILLLIVLIMLIYTIKENNRIVVGIDRKIEKHKRKIIRIKNKFKRKK